MNYIEGNSAWTQEMNRFKKDQLIELIRESYNQKTLLLQSVPSATNIKELKLTRSDLSTYDNSLLTTGYRVGAQKIIDIILTTLNV